MTGAEGGADEARAREGRGGGEGGGGCRTVQQAVQQDERVAQQHWLAVDAIRCHRDRSSCALVECSSRRGSGRLRARRPITPLLALCHPSVRLSDCLSSFLPSLPSSLACATRVESSRSAWQRLVAVCLRRAAMLGVRWVGRGEARRPSPSPSCPFARPRDRDGSDSAANSTLPVSQALTCQSTMGRSCAAGAERATQTEALAKASHSASPSVGTRIGSVPVQFQLGR